MASIDEILVDKIEDTDKNRGQLVSIARSINSYDGSFDEFDVTDDLEVLLGGLSVEDIANKIHFGDYNPSADYYTFDGYENVKSVDESDLEAEAWEQRETIIDWLRENPEAGLSSMVEDLTLED